MLIKQIIQAAGRSLADVCIIAYLFQKRKTFEVKICELFVNIRNNSIQYVYYKLAYTKTRAGDYPGSCGQMRLLDTLIVQCCNFRQFGCIALHNLAAELPAVSVGCA